MLVANLGHNPTRWWQRVLEYLGLDRCRRRRAANSFPAVDAHRYNALTPLEVAGLRAAGRQPAQRSRAAARMEQVLWAATGSEAMQKAIWAALDRRAGPATSSWPRAHGFHGKKGLAGAVTGSEQDPERDPRVRFISFPTRRVPKRRPPPPAARS